MLDSTIRPAAHTEFINLNNSAQLPAFDLTVPNDYVLFVDNDNDFIALNDNWGDNANASDIRAAAVATGAFALGEGSKDSALLLTLDPGAYTAQVSGVGSASGVSLLEIYEVP